MRYRLLGRSGLRVSELALGPMTFGTETMAVAEEIGATPSQVAIAWVRAGEGNIIPVVGARTLDQLGENLGVLEVTLSEVTPEW